MFGAAPKIISNEQDAGSVSIVLGDEASGAPADHDAAPEAFSITSGSATVSGHNARIIRLAGSESRGTLYAIYQFSQHCLGIDPMYYWTDHQPARHASIQIRASLDVKFAAPVFRYRGFFINDEDLLTGWFAGGSQGPHWYLARSLEQDVGLARRRQRAALVTAIHSTF